MRHRMRVIAAALAFALAGAPAGAQQGAEASGPPGSAPGISAGPLMQQRAGDLIGRAVTNEHGENLGRVEKLARRRSDGAVVAIVSTGGFLGFGEKKVAVPADQLRLQGGGRELAIAGVMTSDELEQMAPYTSTGYEPIDDSTRLAEAALSRPAHRGSRARTGRPGPQQGALSRSWTRIGTVVFRGRRRAACARWTGNGKPWTPTTTTS